MGGVSVAIMYLAALVGCVAISAVALIEAFLAPVSMVGVVETIESFARDGVVVGIRGIVDPRRFGVSRRYRSLHHVRLT